MSFVARNPDLVDKMILHCAVGVKGIPFFFPDDKGLPDFSRKAKTLEEVKTLPFINFLLNGVKNPVLLQSMFKDTCFNGPKTPTQDLLEIWADAGSQQRCMLESIWALTSFNISNSSNDLAEGTNEVAKIKCPTLILAGRKDVLCNAEMQEGTKEALGDIATLKIWDDSGHAVLFDHTEEVCEMIKDFIH